MKNYLGVLVLMLAVVGCATPEVASGIHDPFEERNRRVHEMNRRIDQSFFNASAEGGGNNIPRGLLVGASNFAHNWGLPSTVVNNLLQANIGDAAHNTLRFLVNTTVGIGGVFDPAMAGGLDVRESDFGETLYTWGVGEGAYREMPILGPTTTRASVGFVVDFVTNPIYLLLPPGSWYVPPIINTGGRMADRLRFSGSIDSVLNDSEDSYAQARLLYLESRRFKLSGGIDASGGAAEEELYDLYEEVYE